jgi:hypothetical protein
MTLLLGRYSKALYNIDHGVGKAVTLLIGFLVRSWCQ